MSGGPTAERRAPRGLARIGSRWTGPGLVLVAGLAAGGCSLPGSAPPAVRSPGPDGNATVIEVVDGDTVVVDLSGEEERVRLIGIDTPESVAPGRPVECFGPEASRRLGDLLPAGTPVRLERDLEARDLYGRLLAYVYRAADGVQVNLDQVEQGYAAASPYPPNTTHRNDFAAAEREAREHGTGLWGTCGGPDVALAG